jgi:hypothetical protein
MVNVVRGGTGVGVYRSIPTALNLGVVTVKLVCGGTGVGVYFCVPTALSFGVVIVNVVCGAAATSTIPIATQAASLMAS